VVTAWARSGVPTIGLWTFTPAELAAYVLEDAFPDKVLPRLPDLNQVMALDALLEDLDFRRFEALGWSGARLSQSIREMRVSGVSPDDYKSGIPRRLAREVAGILAAYEKWLYTSGVTDETERFVRAEMALSRVPAAALVSVLAETPLSEAGRTFVEAFGGRSDRKGVVRPFEAAQAASGTAGRVLPDWPSIIGGRSGEPKIELARVPAVEDEARFVLEEVERRGLSLDSVEVAYPRHTPYLPLLLGETNRRNLAATSAAGVPLSDLPVGQAARLYLEWLQSDQDSIGLIRLLRSGFVRLPDSVAVGAVTANLTKFHARGTRKAYRRAFQGLRKVAESELEQAKGTDRERSARIRIKRLREAERAIDRLFELVPGPRESVRGFAVRLRRFVVSFVRGVEDPDSAAAKGKAEFVSRLVEIEEGPDSEHAAAHVVERFAEWLQTMIVRARLDAPGSLHITPLDSAGLAGRPHLFVVGLDSANFLPSPVEDVFLPDEFCLAWDRISGPLTSQERVETRRHSLERAIARATDSVCVVAAQGRLADDSQTGPAAAFLDLEARYGKAQSKDVPQTDGINRLILRHRGADLGRQLFEAHFPAAARGRAAVARRATPEFNEFDAFVGFRESVQKTLREPLSPSRLQVLATCPFQYFQARVLGVPKLEERKPGDWMTALENGQLVHEALSRFNHEIMAREAQPGDSGRLLELLQDEFKKFRRANEAPNEFVWRSKSRELARIAQVVCAVDREIITAELGFGQTAWRTQQEHDHVGDFPLQIGPCTISLRGRIDVVEKTARGLTVTDYKTGRSDEYDESRLLDDGKRLQWVLYAYAYEELRGQKVDESGYLFVSGDAAGQTAYGEPPSREDVGGLLAGLVGLAERGEFPPSVDPAKQCKWCDFRRVCGGLRERRDEVRAKLEMAAETGGAYGTGQAAEAGGAGDVGVAGAGSTATRVLDDWPYARKYLKR
jgi:RecB family exonuclease